MTNGFARSGRRWLGAVALVLAVAGGCGNAANAEPGAIVVRVEWIEPAPAEERLGGFAFFARATGPSGPGTESEIGNELVIGALGPGAYVVEARTRHESDAVEIQEVPGGTPRNVRSFGADDAACSAQVEVASAATVRLVMRATPGHCELVPDVGGGSSPANSG
jgi:hypothetical protein